MLKTIRKMKNFVPILLTMVMAFVPSILAVGEIGTSTSNVLTSAVESDIFVERIDDLRDDFMLGADIGSILALECSGVLFYDFDGYEASLFDVLADGGTNWIRARIWNDPWQRDSEGNRIYVPAIRGEERMLPLGNGGGNVDVDAAIEMGIRTTQAGMRFFANFHYSDFWADPERQVSPRAWQGMNITQRSQALYDFTYDAVIRMLEAGIDLGMVQIGNETNNGLAGVTSWPDKIQLFRAGSDAIRDAEFDFRLENEAGFVPETFEPDILIAVHWTDPEARPRFTSAAQQLRNANIDYDVFGISYYPFWHGSLENLVDLMEYLTTTYDVYVAAFEVAYPFTHIDSDGAGNNWSGGGAGAILDYPISVQGQAHAVRDVIAAVASVEGGIGAFLWEPAWITVSPHRVNEDANGWITGVQPGTGAYNNPIWRAHGSGWVVAGAHDHVPRNSTGGSSWDNKAHFNHRGEPLATANLFNYLRTGAVSRHGNHIDLFQIGTSELLFAPGITVDSILSDVLPDTSPVVFADNTRMGIPVTWDRASVENALNSYSGGISTFNISGTIEYPAESGNTFPVTNRLTIRPYNLVRNHSFEEADMSMWRINRISGTNPVVRNNENPMSGTRSFGVGSGPTNFTIEQDFENLPAGYYGFEIFNMGGNAGAGAGFRQYVLLNGEEVASRTFTLTPWSAAGPGNVTLSPIRIEPGLASAGDVVTIGVSVMSNSNNLWMDLDDFYFYIIELIEVQQPTEFPVNWTVEGPGTVVVTIEDEDELDDSLPIGVNVVRNHSFESTDMSMWNQIFRDGTPGPVPSGEGAGRGTGDGANPTTGNASFRWWRGASPTSFALEQSFSDLPPGNYNFNLSITGGFDFAPGQDIYIYVRINDEVVATQETGVTVWGEFHNPEINDIVVRAGDDVTIGISLVTAAGGWGGIDDFYFYMASGPTAIPVELEQGDIVPVGTEVTFAATPDTGFVTVWSDNVTVDDADENVATISVTGPVNELIRFVYGNMPIPVTSELYVSPVLGLDEDFIRGADVGSWYSLMNSGTVEFHNTDGDEDCLFQILADANFNYVRLRVWNQPYIYIETPEGPQRRGFGGGNVDVDAAIYMGVQAAEAGLQTKLAFHYSDSWADPGKQFVPRAWANSPVDQPHQTIGSRAYHLYNYTFDAVYRALEAGVDLGMVAIGNETNGSMAGVSGWGTVANPGNVVHLARAGSEAVRDAEREFRISQGEFFNDVNPFIPEIKIAFHTSTPFGGHNTRPNTVPQILMAADIDFDVYGVSTYPQWGHFTAGYEALTARMQQFYDDMNPPGSTRQRHVMSFEVSHPTTVKSGNAHENIAPRGHGGGEPNWNHPISVQGSATAIRDLVDAVNNIEGDNIGGVFLWEPAWIPEFGSEGRDGRTWERNFNIWETYGSGWASSYAAAHNLGDEGQMYGGGAHCNQSIFDFDGHPLANINIFHYVYSGAIPEDGSIIDVITTTTARASQSRLNYTTITYTKEVTVADIVAELPSEMVAWTRANEPMNVPMTWDTSQLSDIVDYVNDNFGAHIFEVTGRTYDAGLGDYAKTTRYLVLTPPNLVSTPHFNNLALGGWLGGTPSNWTVTRVCENNSPSGTLNRQIRTESHMARIGGVGLGFYRPIPNTFVRADTGATVTTRSGALDMTATQNITIPADGVYAFEAFVAGDYAGDGDFAIFIRVGAEERYREEFDLNGYRNWVNPIIEDMFFRAGDVVTIGFDMNATRGGVGIIDAAYFYRTGERERAYPVYWTVEGPGTVVATIEVPVECPPDCDCPDCIDNGGQLPIGINVVQNPTFAGTESLAPPWNLILRDGTPASNSGNGAGFGTRNAIYGGRSLSWWAQANASFALEQTFTDLPAGNYNFQIRIMGGYAHVAQNIYTYVRINDAVVATRPTGVTAWQEFHYPRIEDIAVTPEDTVTIGVSLQMGASGWGGLGDFRFYMAGGPGANQGATTTVELEQGQLVPVGTLVTFTATPDAGYETLWTDNVTVDGDNRNIATFTVTEPINELIRFTPRGLPTPAVSELYISPVLDLDDDFIRGADIGSWYSLMSSGTVAFHNTDGEEDCLFQILADANFNYVRLRVWNQPYIYIETPDGPQRRGYGGGNIDIDTAIYMGVMAAEVGLQTKLAFHYSDSWADPGKQFVPRAWANSPVNEPHQSVGSRAYHLYNYTFDAVYRALEAGVDLGIVAIGNETNGNIAGFGGWGTVESPGNAIHAARAGSEAVRDAEREFRISQGEFFNDVNPFIPEIKIAFHTSTPFGGHNTRPNSVPQILMAAEIDFDVYGVSTYPQWGHFTAGYEALTTRMQQFYDDINPPGSTRQRHVMSFEVSHPTTVKSGNAHENIAPRGHGGGEPNWNHPISVQGSATAIRDLVEAVNNIGGDNLGGVFLWEPAWIPEFGSEGRDGRTWERNFNIWETYGSGWASSYAAAHNMLDEGQMYGGGAHCNQSIFDFDGHPLANINIFHYVYSGAVPEDGSTIDIITSTVARASQSRLNYTTVTYIYELTVADIIAALPSEMVAWTRANDPINVPMTWDEDQLLDIVDYVNDNFGAHIFEVTGRTYDVGLGDYAKTTRYLVLTPPNLVSTPHFNNLALGGWLGGTPSNWTVTRVCENNSPAGALNRQIRTESHMARIGGVGLGFYRPIPNTFVRADTGATVTTRSGALDMTATQNITIPADGVYAFEAFVAGDYAGDGDFALFVSVGGEERHREEFDLHGYRNWVNPIIEGMAFEAGDVVTIGFDMNASRGGVGIIDAAYFYKIPPCCENPDICPGDNCLVCFECSEIEPCDECGKCPECCDCCDLVTITVTFDPNSGTVNPISRVVTVGSTFGGAFPMPTRPGYVFQGWFTATEGGDRIRGTDTVIQSADITLFAQWRREGSIIVNFNPNGGTVTEASRTVIPGETFGGAFRMPTRPGYIFMGWFTAPTGGARILGTNTVTQTFNFTLFAQWRPENSIVVTFNPNGGTTTETSRVAIPGAENFGGAFRMPTRPGYIFMGWFTARVGGDRVLGTGEVTQTSNFTLFARWRPEGSIIVTFNPNGGTVTETSRAVMPSETFGGAFHMPTRPGYIFTGWFTARVGGDRIRGTDIVTQTSNVTLFAQWRREGSIIVTFNPTGGTVTETSRAVMPGETFGGAFRMPTRPGYIFEGWFTAAVGGDRIRGTDTVRHVSNFTLFARWRPE